MPIQEFYQLDDFAIADIEHLVAQARSFENGSAQQSLTGKVLALLFLNPSLRTLTSFQATMSRLGGGAFVVSPEMSIHRLETRSGIVMDGSAAEHIREAVPVIASYADAIGIRVMAEKRFLDYDLQDSYYREIRDLCEIPVLNLESAIRHPFQSLADWKTLDDLEIPGKGGKLVFSWVYHPEAQSLAVPADTIQMAAARGMQVEILRPEGFGLPESLLERANEIGKATGGSVGETTKRRKALEGADVVYAGSWSSTEHYGSAAEDRKLRDAHEDWCLDETWFDRLASKDCRFMHCLPVRRGVEVDDEILDGARSVVIRQAQNRMYTQMSVMHEILA